MEFSYSNVSCRIKAISNIDIYKNASPKFVAQREISDSGFKYKITELKIRESRAAFTRLENEAGTFIATISHPTHNLFIEISCEGRKDYYSFYEIISTFRFLE